ncbi:hypothetical protein E1J38_014755 [Seonamhaeicola sediminis]|uniref:Uncharacterized protein n=1 Tax=Seonamhaeicola sediminis TaxID=2528206 RepID=A0A562Y816_9FLAO|nr:hypothetical protein [Seonamhaeicola sediminis]TWO30412.1 hypothetical protein E1J38_014755 [Seonamhaeicola sediminis]
MDIQDVLRILKNGAEKPKDDLNDYTKGKRDGQVQAYSHAWTLVKNLSISGVSQQSELLKAVEKLKYFAHEVCPLHRQDDLEEIVKSL